MKSNHSELPSTEIFSGWKSIAKYLDKGVRTVQRYEREHGLPVRRPAGRRKGSVVATKAELDAWLTAGPIRQQFRIARTGPEMSIGALQALKQSVEDMRQLGKQMWDLRAEVHASLEMLRSSIAFASTETAEDLFRYTNPAVAGFFVKQRKIN